MLEIDTELGSQTPQFDFLVDPAVHVSEIQDDGLNPLLISEGPS